MRRSIIILVACVLVSVPVILLLCIPTASFSATKQRIALVIGNSAYKNAPLRNPVNDATDMASALRNLGFKVTLKTDANLRVMKRAIRDLGKELKKGGVGLFYYSGHGVQVNGRNYLIPVNATIESEGDVEFETIDAGLVLAKMEDAGNSLNINILDACRDNPFTRGFRSMTKGLAIMEAPHGSILSFSTSPGEVASDGSGRNGLYTSMLLKYITTPGLEVGRIFRKVRTDVMETSHNKQVPWELSSLTGDFYFTPKMVAEPVENKTKAEEEAWNIVNGISTIEGYAMFLKKYPGSKFASVAKSKIQALKEHQKRVNIQTTRKAEEAAWETVKASSSIEDFALFLDKYPESKFTTAAKLKIQQLEREKNTKAMLASINPSLRGIPISARDGDFVKFPNTIVYDTITGLEWYAGPDEEVSWEEARLRVKKLDIDGGGWRMPSKEELETLYRKGVGTRNMTSLLTNSSWSVWFLKPGLRLRIGEHGDGAYNFYADHTYPKKYPTNFSSFNRVFAVRKRK